MYPWSGPLQEDFAKIGGLSFVTSSTPKPLLKIYFNSRAQALYVSLCKSFGIDQKEYVPGCFLFMMA